MSEYVTREEFDNTVNNLKETINILLIQTSISQSMATSLASSPQNIQNIINALEQGLPTITDTFFFSPTEQQKEPLKAQYINFIESLRHILKKLNESN
ncbi:MAG: hypothetical protein D3922_10675 [Candidatus Electrothrix sp. AR1]|nr:hypothetical protein [Candidatus Electrothrix sp. AR1]